MRLLWTSLAFAVAALVPTVVQADFGDFADPTFSCPATTTCPVICVAAAEDCPTACDDDALTLCADGTCAETCDDSLESPCPADCASVACPKVIALYNQCQEEYGEFYDEAVACAEAEIAESVELVDFNEPGFVFAYCWVSIITVALFAWCAFNQRVSPAPSVQVSDIDGQLSPCWQTGYRWHWLGTFLFVNTILTFLGWIALLAWLTIQYYALDGSKYVSKRKIHFEDEIQLLKTFIIVWSVGFTWSFTLKWPYSIQSLFWRRCSLDQANFVAFFQESATPPNIETAAKEHDSTGFGWKTFEPAFRGLSKGFTAVMATIFSDRDRWHCREGRFAYSPVKKTADGTRYLVFSLQRYNFNRDEQRFLPATWSIGTTLGHMASQSNGLSSEECDARVQTVGWNSIEMKEPFFLVELFNEFKKPFYTYQLYMVWSWMPLYYYYMALVWTGVISTSALLVSWFHYRNLRNLYRVTKIFGKAKVLRDGEWTTVDQKKIVPGDVVQLETGKTYCDMVLLSSATCLVDESALTGESYPQAKSPIDPVDHPNNYDSRTHKRHTITAGTSILESEESIAIVINTGSATSKGKLLRDIFGFQRHKFKFDTEVLVVLFILFLYAVFGFNIVVYFIEDVTVYGWFYGMYVVASTLPPLLPTVFTVSVGVSDDRLSKKRIATANSESILIAGKVTRAFFDKTGTLTRQGLDYTGTRCVETWAEDEQAKPSDRMTMAMAVCHSLTASSEGNLVGNPVDQTMFNASGGKMTSSGIVDGTGRTVKVVRHFDFDHHTMTQSVVVQLEDGKLIALVKGSGESLMKLCNKGSLPDVFEHVIEESARNGIYQICVGSKPFSTDSIGDVTREQVECELDLVGCIDFCNIMREETPDVISQLAGGSITSTMVTGDSVLTGIRIALESGILRSDTGILVGKVGTSENVSWTSVDGTTKEFPGLETVVASDMQIALSGSAWTALSEDNPKLAMGLAPFVRVFGRCTPQDKVSVVRFFVDQGFVTLMCGDGGNDTGALKTAHVGIALSDAEASMVAPFASLDKDIRSVLDVLKEGRCALASAIATYKYMIMYGQTTTINQIINAYFQITFAEWCWVFMDGIWTLTVAMTLPLAKPAAKLAPTRPTASILGLHTLSSTLGVLFINLIYTVIALFLLWGQDFFQCRKWEFNDVSNVLVIGDNYESSVIFLVTGFQYFATGMAFNFGYEFRQGWLRNYWFVLFVTVFTFLHFYATMVPGKLSCFWRLNCENENVVNGVTAREKMPIQNPFNTTLMPESFRAKILVIMIANLISIVVYEYFIVNGLRRRWAMKKREAQMSEPLLKTTGDSSHSPV